LADKVGVRKAGNRKFANSIHYSEFGHATLGAHFAPGQPAICRAVILKRRVDREKATAPMQRV
jgi:hypothetical protein